MIKKGREEENKIKNPRAQFCVERVTLRHNATTFPELVKTQVCCYEKHQIFN